MSSRPRVPVIRLPHGAGLDLPHYATALAAGMDLRAATDMDAPPVLQPGARLLVPTGIAFALPAGYEAQVRPRSGLAIKHGLTLINSPGTVDADYRGEILVPMVNHGDAAFTLERGLRIAQLVIAPVIQADWHLVESLPESARGSGGFGSTGVG